MLLLLLLSFCFFAVFFFWNSRFCSFKFFLNKSRYLLLIFFIKLQNNGRFWSNDAMSTKNKKNSNIFWQNPSLRLWGARTSKLRSKSLLKVTTLLTELSLSYYLLQLLFSWYLIDLQIKKFEKEIWDLRFET